ncbi:hypothetical protein ACFL0H_14440 [Thermodesulfobacteriota bacterium]
MDPGIDGLETYKEIVKRHPGQKAIIASGFSETERIRAAQKLGVSKYVRKLYTLEKIGKAVRKELDRYSSRYGCYQSEIVSIEIYSSEEGL